MVAEFGAFPMKILRRLGFPVSVSALKGGVEDAL